MEESGWTISVYTCDRQGNEYVRWCQGIFGRDSDRESGGTVDLLDVSETIDSWYPAEHQDYHAPRSRDSQMDRSYG